MKTRKIFRCLLTLMLFFAFAKSGSAETVTYQFNSDGKMEVTSGTMPQGVTATYSGFTKEGNLYCASSNGSVISFENFDFKVQSIKLNLTLRRGRTYGKALLNNLENDGKGEINGEWSDKDKDYTWQVYINNQQLKLKTINIASTNINANSDNVPVYVKSVTIEYVAPSLIATSTPISSFIQLGNSVDLKQYLQVDNGGDKTNLTDFFKTNSSYKLVYSSSNPSVISVDNNGSVKALSDGSATINVSLKNNGVEISQYETTLCVKRFFTDNNCSLKTYSSSGNQNKMTVSALNSTGYYTFEYNGVIENGGYYKIGTLQSTNSKNYRVGFQTMKLLTAYPYTKVKVNYDFKIDVSANIQNAPAHGAELFIAPASNLNSTNTSHIQKYESIQLLTTASIEDTQSSNYTLCRVVSSGVNTNKKMENVVIDNSNNENSNDFYFAMMAFARRDNSNFTQSANFWYKPVSSSVEYYTYVKYNKNDGSNTVSAETTLKSTDKTTEVALPKCSFSTDRSDKVFIGWNTQADGKGEFFKSKITPYNPATGGGRGHITLYAIWHEKSTSKVNFHYTQTIEKKKVDVGDYEYYSSKYNHLNNVESYNSKYTTPVAGPEKEGYIFDGWVDKEQNGEIVYFGDGKAREGSYWVKNADGELVWKSTQSEVNLYPQWIKDATFASVNIIRDNNYEGTNVNHRYVGVAMAGMTSVVGFHGKGYITIDGENYLSTKENGGEDQILSVPLEEAPIWNFVEDDRGYIISTEVEDAQGKTKTLYLGMKLLNSNDPSQGYKKNGLGIQTVVPDMRFTIYNEKGWICYGENEKIYNHILYMKDETKAWEYEDTGDNEQYKPIRILAYGAGVGYGNLNSTKVVAAIKKELTNPKYAYNVGTTPSIDDPDLCKGVLYVDMGGAANIIEENSSDLANFKSLTSDNCLFFVPSNYKNNLGNNVVGFDGVSYKSLSDLVIKDKMPFSSPYTFHLGNYTASYTRESANKWSSLFLPFQVKANDNIKFYELYGSDEVRLAYQSIGENAVPANKPIACFGSGTFTLTNTNVEVMKDPVDLSKGPYSEELFAFTSEDIREFAENFGSAKPEAGSEDCEAWQLVGTRFARYIYGTENAGAMPVGSNVEKRNVYYFSGGNFTYVNPKGRVLFAPFRAYYQLGANSSIKTFSIIAFDENDGATDITDVMTGNDSEGDGKIYDLMGRRVKMPLKGHVYVVNGKKKLY